MLAPSAPLDKKNKQHVITALLCFWDLKKLHENKFTALSPHKNGPKISATANGSHAAQQHIVVSKTAVQGVVSNTKDFAQSLRSTITAALQYV